MTAQRVLLVCDGSLSFDHSDDGLGQLVANLRALNEHSIETMVSTDARAGLATLVVDGQRAFEQIWIFANADGVTLEPGNALGLRQFMQLGGGVFITGDHQRLGALIGENVPRIRQMRRWQDTDSPIGGGGRINTLIPISISNYGDEMDQTAKPIFPQRVRSGNPEPSNQIHPLLRHNLDQFLRWLPDHGHEGNLTLGGLDDFVPDETAVSTVAWAVAWNQAGLAGERGGAVASPRMMPVINCFDPALASPGSTWGPLVVDSTYHHFLNHNVGPQLLDASYAAHWRSYLSNLLMFLMPSPHRTVVAELVKERLQNHIVIDQLLQDRALPVSPELRAKLQSALKSILARQPLSHRLLLLHEKTQCSTALCARLANELSGYAAHS